MKEERLGGRKDSDEHYVLDICDKVLGLRARRQHTFDWLRGDTGRRLQVDAFYPEIALVVEYRERQHDQPGPGHWNKPTVSGMPRDQQRMRYDLLRDIEVPAHGLRLLVLKPEHLDATPRGRLSRKDRAGDVGKVWVMLREMGC